MIYNMFNNYLAVYTKGSDVDSVLVATDIFYN